MVPREGLEPPRLAATDFESAASTIPPPGHVSAGRLVSVLDQLRLPFCDAVQSARAGCIWHRWRIYPSLCSRNSGETNMRLVAFALAASFVVAPALAQPLPAPASYPPVVGEKGVVTSHELSLDM